MIHFAKIASPEPVVDYITKILSEHLAGRKNVLWLVPGGSSIAIAVEVSKRLTGHDLQKLTVTLTDERWGDIGHRDSNWRQLEQTGFRLPGANLIPVLTGSDRDDTAQAFGETLEEEFGRADYRLGFFGIGADGHTAGILPETPAVNAEALAIGYDAGAFQRLTMTPTAIKYLDEAVVYATGDAKWPVLDNLDRDIELNLQPAQSLKQVSKLTIFNDHRGDLV